MSIWAHRKTFNVWDADYQPENKTGEIWIHTASNWNDCIRLDVSEPGAEQFAPIASVMLDREMAQQLADYLHLYAVSGVAAYEYPNAEHDDADGCIAASRSFQADLESFPYPSRGLQK